MTRLTQTVIVLSFSPVLLIVSLSALPTEVRAGRVEGHDRDVHRVWVPAGVSRVWVDGDGGTDLDCIVYDRTGAVRGFDNGLSDRCRIEIRQRAGGDVQIEIENLGRVPNSYRLEVR